MNRDEKLIEILKEMLDKQDDYLCEHEYVYRDYCKVYGNLLDNAIKKINKLFKGKAVYWCPSFKRYNSFKCSKQSVTEHRIVNAKCINKDCNLKCRVILED